MFEKLEIGSRSPSKADELRRAASILMQHVSWITAPEYWPHVYTKLMALARAAEYDSKLQEVERLRAEATASLSVADYETAHAKVSSILELRK